MLPPDPKWVASTTVILFLVGMLAGQILQLIGAA